MQKCTAVRTVSTDRPKTNAMNYPMEFKTSTTYVVDNGYKVWLTSSDTEVSSAKDGDQFEIMIEEGMALYATLFAIITSACLI